MLRRIGTEQEGSDTSVYVLQQEGSATVNFRLNFRALSKCVKFHPCAVAQGRDGKGG